MFCKKIDSLIKPRIVKTVGRYRMTKSLQLGVALDWDKDEIILHLFFLCWWLIVEIKKAID